MTDLQDWINSEFTVEDLHGKIVDYHIQDGGHTFAGEGKLIAISRGDLMRVRVVCQMEMDDARTKVMGAAYCIMGRDAHKLVRNPSGSKNPFSFRCP